MRRRFGLGALFCAGVAVTGTMTSAQSLVDARALTLGAYAPAVRDTREFPANPAGLVQIRDWDFSVTTYTGTTPESFGFVFHALSFGKRLYEEGALAVRYAPGTEMTFVVPTTLLRSHSCHFSNPEEYHPSHCAS